MEKETSGTRPKGDASRRQVLQGLTLTGLASTGVTPSLAAIQTGSESFDPHRWWTQDYRIVQTNLREIDAREDPREIVKAVKDFGANAIVSNIGGIVAFYPTKLELHYRTPYLKGDFVRQTIEAARDAGMAYLGRFDTSKAMKKAYQAHPDWFMVDRNGQPREYDGTYAACPNGDWAQTYTPQILEEALSQYKPDGIFFNGGGFRDTDYSNVDHGICVCANCKRVFREMFNRDLPKVDGFADPAWPDYLEFQARVIAANTAKTTAIIHRLVPDAPIMSRSAVVGRGELQRRVYRPAPEWAYQGGEQARTAFALYPDRAYSSTSTAHMDYPWRQVTETAACHQLRFAQQMGAGAHLDLYLMGPLDAQDDPSYLPPLSALFKWRAANTASYAGMKQAARVALYLSGHTARSGARLPHSNYATGAFRGAYMALVDSRIPFQFVAGDRVADGTANLSAFDVIVMPHVTNLTPEEAAGLDKFVEAGGLLIASGMTAGFDKAGNAVENIPLASFPLRRYGTPSNAHGWSLDPTKGSLKLTGRVPIDALYFGGEVKPGVKDLVPFAPDQRFGPPELSYAIPGTPIRNVPGVAAMSHGKGYAIHIPWLPGWQYHRDGMPVHQQLYAGLISKFAAPQTCTLSGIGPVELMYLRRGDSGPLLLHVVNYAGQRNGLYATAPQIHGLSIGVRGVAASNARALVSGQSLKSRPGEAGVTWFDLPPLGPFEAVFIDA